MSKAIVHIRQVISWHKETLTKRELLLLADADMLDDVRGVLSTLRENIHHKNGIPPGHLMGRILATRGFRRITLSKLNEMMDDVDRRQSEVYSVLIRVIDERRIIRHERTTDNHDGRRQ